MDSIDHWFAIAAQIALALAGVATLITGLTNTPRDDEIVGKIFHVLGKIFGFAKHKDAAGTFKLPLQDPGNK